jgi:hypothetical protein
MKFAVNVALSRIVRGPMKFARRSFFHWLLALPLVSRIADTTSCTS